mgnify:CR=1 FL=1
MANGFSSVLKDVGKSLREKLKESLISVVPVSVLDSQEMVEDWY